MITIHGRVADDLGHASTAYLVQGRVGPEVRHEHYSLPASEYRHRQPSRIALDVDHRDPLDGQVELLELDEQGSLWAVATVADDALARVGSSMFYSPVVAHRDGTDIELRSLALTMRPGTVAQLAVVVVPGELASAADYAAARGMSCVAARLRRAVEYRRGRRVGDSHRICSSPVDPSTATYLGSGAWIVADELVVEQRTRVESGIPEDRPKNLVADPQGLFAVDLGGIKVAARARLMLDRDPIGQHDATLDRDRMVVFRATATAKAVEAVQLVSEGVYWSASALRRLDGVVSTVVIDLD